MKKKLITFTLLTVLFGGVSALAATVGDVNVGQGVLSGTLSNAGYKAADATTNLKQPKLRTRAYVYLVPKGAGGVVFPAKQGYGAYVNVGGAPSNAYVAHQNNSATNFWSTHRAEGASGIDSRSLALKV